MTPPCKDCTCRNILCHSVCTLYKDFVTKNETIKNNKTEYLRTTCIIVDSVRRNTK